MYLQSGQRLGSPGLGLCVVPKQVRVRKLICTDADLAAIGAEMGKGRGLVIREVRVAIEDAVRRAIVLIERAEGQLKKPRVTGQAGDAMRQRFRDAFGTAPEFVPTWRPAGHTWDVGAVVRERLRCAAKIMSEGDIEFVAWGPGSCPFAFDWATRPWAVVQGGRFRICLGQTFWQAAGGADTEGMATTLLHECLHIYFDSIRHRLERWAYNTATCYERYVLLCSGIPIPPAVGVPCPSKAPGVPVAARRGKVRTPALAGSGVSGLAQPRDTSDTGRSIEAITKALQINPADGYVKGGAARRKLDVAFLSVPLPSALALHKQLSAAEGALGRMFRQRLHRATRKALLDVLWSKQLAHQKVLDDAQRALKEACDRAKAEFAAMRVRLAAIQRSVDEACSASGEDSDACQRARFALLTTRTRLEHGLRRQQSMCP
jgi:hypothetical protein